jgi:hypothetical protein
MQFTIYVSVLISLLPILKYFEIGVSCYKFCIWISVISFSIFVFIRSISFFYLVYKLYLCYFNVGDCVKVFGRVNSNFESFQIMFITVSVDFDNYFPFLLIVAIATATKHISLKGWFLLQCRIYSYSFELYAVFKSSWCIISHILFNICTVILNILYKVLP